MLVDWKAEQDEMKEILGDEYMDYNLVMASTFGLPLGDGAIRGPLKKLIEDYNLPPVVFHSFRHPGFLSFHPAQLSSLQAY